MRSRIIPLGAALALLLCVTGAARSQTIVFKNLSNNGFFTPFSSSSAAGVKYGDGGWLTAGGSPPVTLNQITLGLAASGGAPQGTTDVLFTFNDGDPSGLAFGPGTALYSTTITGVTLPDTTVGPEFFSLTIPLPNVVTAGNFNNIGFSVGVQNFDYAGNFGFQCSTALGQTIGFYTNNASFYDGSSWSLFAFGPDSNTGVANFVATIQSPEPASIGVLTPIVLLLARRRRH